MKDYLSIVNGILAALCAGIFMASAFQQHLLTVYWLCGILWLILLLLLFKQRREIFIGLFLLFCLLGIMRTLQIERVDVHDVSHFVGETLDLSGEVMEVTNVEKGADGSQKIKGTVNITSIRRNGQSVKANGGLNFSIAQGTDKPICHAGDQISYSGRIEKIRDYHNPGRIDVEALKARQGISAVSRGIPNSLQIVKSGEGTLKRLVENLRSDILSRMLKAMPDADAAALFAMLFGGYGGIKPELIAAFTATGIIHILSVSGSHITLLAAAVQSLLKPLRLPPFITVIAVVFTIGFYAVVAGFCPPVLRSSVMGALAFIAIGCNRQSDARYLLSLVAIIMLLVSPKLLFDLSFQLSFAATAGLLYLSPKLRQTFKLLPAWIAENLAVTTAAQLATVPFIAWYFNNISLCSLLANLFAVPIIEWVIVVGLAGAVIGEIFLPAGHLLLVICSMGIGIVYNIAREIAKIPYGVLFLPSGGLSFGFFYYGLLAWSCGLLPAGCPSPWLFWHKHRRVAYGGLILISLYFLLQFYKEEPLKIHFIDVGQGDAVLVVTPHRKAIIIDTGGTRKQRANDYDVGERVVVPYLRHYGVKEVQYLLLTHAHEDHAGGAAAVIKYFPVAHVVIGREDRASYAKTLGCSLEKIASFIPAYTGQKLVVDGVVIHVVHAAETLSRVAGNETSNVFAIDYEGQRFLITGDLTAEGESAILEERADIKSTVLKVAHHGSRTSTTDAFLTAVSPQLAVISVGAGNTFGHPSSEVLERLMRHDARTFRTDINGAIVMECSREGIQVRTFQ